MLPKGGLADRPPAPPLPAIQIGKGLMHPRLPCFVALILCLSTLSPAARGQSGTRVRRYVERRVPRAPQVPGAKAPNQRASDAQAVIALNFQAEEKADNTRPETVKAEPPVAIDRAVVAKVVHLRQSLALGGNDPVLLVETGNLVRGMPNLGTTYDGQIYHFATDESRQRFDADPTSFAPVLGGDSIVAWIEHHERLAGSADQVSVYGGRIYLFATGDEKRAFDADPKRYFDGDIALQGFSPVSLVDDEVLRRGDKAFLAVQDGLRLYLVDQAERDKFNANPGRYFPSLGGIDPLSIAEGKPALGQARFSTVYKNRLYVSASGESRDRFIANAAPYSDLDVAKEGHCPVTLAETQKQVSGHYGISTLHRGVRLLFASEENREKFRADPEKYFRE